MPSIQSANDTGVKCKTTLQHSGEGFGSALNGCFQASPREQRGAFLLSFKHRGSKPVLCDARSVAVVHF